MVKPATHTANHMKVRIRENAGRNNQIAFHQRIQSDDAAGRLLSSASLCDTIVVAVGCFCLAFTRN